MSGGARSTGRRSGNSTDEARKIRIVRVIARLNVGGPARHAIHLTEGLDPDRFRSVLVTGIEGPDEGSMKDLAREHGVEPIVVPEMAARTRLTLQDAIAFRRIVEVLRRERPHIVHTHTSNAGFLGRLAAKMTRVPLILHTFHGHILRGYYGPLMTRSLRWMERGLARITDRIVTVSEGVKDDLVGLGVADAGRIAVVPLGLDLAPYLECEAERGAFRAELGLGDGGRTRPLVGIVGRLVPIKNHELFLEAAARLAGTDAGARFVVVGDGPLRSELEARARELGIEDRVTFTGWRSDLARIYADLDVLVVSSDNEGTPVAAIEAMAAAVPVVATRVGGVPDLVEDGVNGLLVEPGDAASLAAGIREILSDEEAARRMGRQGRARARERHGVDRLIRDMEALYTYLFERGAARR